MTTPDEACTCTCGGRGCASRIPRGRGVKGGPQHGVKGYREGCRCDDCVAAREMQKKRTESRRFAETASGENRGKQWTSAEMEVAMRDDLSLKEIAVILGRTYKAVRMMRVKCRNEPKYQRMLGASAKPRP